MDDLVLSPELRSYICSLGCLYNGQRYHDYGTKDQLLAHNTQSKHKRLVALLKKLGIYEIVDLGLMTVEQALESSFFNGTKLDKTDINMEITENESSSKKRTRIGSAKVVLNKMFKPEFFFN